MISLAHLSPDVIALAIVAGGAVYGVFRGAPGVRIAILAPPAGYVAATELSSWVPSQSKIPAGTTQVIILALVVLAFALTQHHPARHGSAVVGAVGEVGWLGYLALSMALLVVPTAYPNLADPATLLDFSLRSTSFFKLPSFS